MSTGGRSPDTLLGELGASLDRAFRVGPRAHHRRARRLFTVAVVLAVVGGSTAAATQLLLAPAPPLPGLRSPLAIFATGSTEAGPWTLEAGRCTRPAGVTLILTLSSVGAGSSCGHLVGPPGTVYGRGGGVAFGVVPDSAARVELTLGRSQLDVGTITINRRALRFLGITTVPRAYVAVLPAGRTLTAMTAFDRDGHLVLACQPRSCLTP